MCLALPGRIVSIEGTDLFREASVDFEGVRRKASLALLPEAEVGSWVLVHAGVAIQCLAPERAALMREQWEEVEP